MTEISKNRGKKHISQPDTKSNKKTLRNPRETYISTPNGVNRKDYNNYDDNNDAIYLFIYKLDHFVKSFYKSSGIQEMQVKPVVLA